MTWKAWPAALGGAVAGGALTPFVVGLLPEPQCRDTIAACAARDVTAGWLLLCATAGAVLAVALVVLAGRLRRS